MSNGVEEFEFLKLEDDFDSVHHRLEHLLQLWVADFSRKILDWSKSNNLQGYAPICLGLEDFYIRRRYHRIQFSLFGIHVFGSRTISRNHLRPCHMELGTGKVVKVAVFAQGTVADELKAAGAYIVGAGDLVEGILNGNVKIDEFDTCIATPQMIPHIQKLARVLVCAELSISFRMDKTSNVHVGLRKVTFEDDKLRENIGTFVNALLLAKPAGLKKTSKYAGYVNSFHLCSTMGPGFSVSIDSLAKAADQISRLQVK